MKHFKIITLIAFLLALITLSCQNEDIPNQTILKIEEYGKIHNESVHFLLNKYPNHNLPKDFNTLNNDLQTMMQGKYPEIYNSVERLKFNDYLSNENQVFVFEDFYNNIKKIAIKEGASSELIDFYDLMFLQFKENRSFSKKEIKDIENLIKKEAEIKNIAIFNSIYDSSKILWSKEVSNVSFNHSRGCDPEIQVIMADGISGGLLAFISGPFGAFGGAAISAIVKAQQNDNYGGCI